jgi:hypothetical protein
MATQEIADSAMMAFSVRSPFPKSFPATLLQKTLLLVNYTIYGEARVSECGIYFKKNVTTSLQVLLSDWFEALGKLFLHRSHAS